MKIFILLFKEAAKPLAARLKHSAKEHEKFRNYTMVLGRVYERATQRVEVWSLGFRVKQFKEITDTHALTVGADVISQTFLISVALLLLVVEYTRANKASAAAAAQKQVEKAARNSIKKARLAEMDRQILELAVKVEMLESGHRSSIAAKPVPAEPDNFIVSADIDAVISQDIPVPVERTWQEFGYELWSWFGLSAKQPSEPGVSVVEVKMSAHDRALLLGKLDQQPANVSEIVSASIDRWNGHETAITSASRTTKLA